MGCLWYGNRTIFCRISWCNIWCFKNKAQKRSGAFNIVIILYLCIKISKIKNDGDNKLIILAPERYHFDLENIALDMTSDKSLSKIEK